jgi:hypothetical protein
MRHNRISQRWHDLHLHAFRSCSFAVLVRAVHGQEAQRPVPAGVPYTLLQDQWMGPFSMLDLTSKNQFVFIWGATFFELLSNKLQSHGKRPQKDRYNTDMLQLWEVYSTCWSNAISEDRNFIGFARENYDFYCKKCLVSQSVMSLVILVFFCSSYLLPLHF